MTRKHTGILILILLALLLCACGNKEKYEPFTPLSKATISPERDAAVQSAANSGANAPAKQPAPETAPTEEPEVLPTFDENSFFSEIGTDPKAADEDPFGVEPTATSKPKKSKATAEPAPAEPTAKPKKSKATAEPVAAEPTAKPKKAKATAAPVPAEPTAVRPYDPNIMMYGKDSEGRTTYTLQDGEDLICIGRRFDVRLTQLLSLNGFSAPEDAKTGAVITLPDDPESWSQQDGYGRRRLNPHPALVNPRESDNLFSLACAFGDVLPEDIATANKLVLGEPIPTGMQVSIP